MHRLSYVVVALALSNRQPGTIARETASERQPGIVGAWFVTTLLDGQPPSPNMTSCYADGIVLTSNRPVYPSATEGSLSGATRFGHGP